MTPSVKEEQRTMACPHPHEFKDKRRSEVHELLKKTDFGNFRRNPDGERLIAGWFDRARETMEKAGEPHEDQPEVFESFIYAWIAFNGWAACITTCDRDQDWRDVLMVNQEVNRDFADFVAVDENRGDKIVATFAALWPIFKVQELRELRRSHPELMLPFAPHLSNNREILREHYFAMGAREFQPGCWQTHPKERMPLDWPHTLAALYRVRCNLFHGEKAAESGMDQSIVSAANSVLIGFLQHAQYLAV